MFLCDFCQAKELSERRMSEYSKVQKMEKEATTVQLQRNKNQKAKRETKKVNLILHVLLFL